MDTKDYELACIRRFRDAARRGKSPGASSGERIAHRLAKAIHTLAKDGDLQVLDPEIIRGATTLIRFASGPFPSDSTREQVHATIRQCAGIKS